MALIFKIILSLIIHRINHYRKIILSSKPEAHSGDIAQAKRLIRYQIPASLRRTGITSYFLFLFITTFLFGAHCGNISGFAGGLPVFLKFTGQILTFRGFYRWLACVFKIIFQRLFTIKDHSSYACLVLPLFPKFRCAKIFVNNITSLLLLRNSFALKIWRLRWFKQQTTLQYVRAPDRMCS